MIYLDTSIVLAALFNEQRRPPDALWQSPTCSSRLLQYEAVVRLLPVPLRTLDAIHLSTLLYLKGRGLSLELATYDKRLADAAVALGTRLAKV